MGTEYDLFKPDKKERFELGKGHFWPSVFGSYNGDSFKIKEQFKAPHHSNSVYAKLLTEAAFYFSVETPIGFFKDLAEKIYVWCGDDDIQLHSQDSFNELFWEDSMKTYDDHQKKFPYTGTRYIS